MALKQCLNYLLELTLFQLSLSALKKNRVKLSAKSNHFSLAFDLNAMLKLLIKAF